MKKILSVALLSLLVVILVACKASEKDRVISATVDSACLAKTVMDQFNPSTLQDRVSKMNLEEIGKLKAEIDAKQKELETQIEEIYKKYDFETKEAFETAAGKYENDSAVKNEVKEKALSQCNVDLDKLGQF
ncbi:MAG: hypothetical protein UR28_C0009G0024 [Candidatus Peregrinibacteria bacterium GW2011_GWF2_33_10]|nr:MAG: hypothetical protein UR28_C0009G0024 [Candidatus Peregrinibacteria bacterium GW2011_GWF2_33_10]OGJ44743.1 MAG: hypothetical protein A2263_02140 [Candidatus Peregrinibacteria bacterium RIFOXYA2_FULL_33_21]OGJ47342.1 MAG: hypothetical protein A2272_00610 [Candidatus Peregrinibacteria bacterium RIFOXYA12_FULL_33_12]OGJ50609.1 MAG: hypothetical protein A2307_00125 [Candidatus Peregrinibacteria bacterium RIFOXYB2_FULL_33_20]